MKRADYGPKGADHGLVLLFGANQAAAQGTGGNAFAVQDNEFCDATGAAGTPISATPEGFAVDVAEAGTPEGEVSINSAGTPVVGTPAAIVVDAFGDDVLDLTDEGALCQDVDGDGIYEIGIDTDQDGTLDENEALGADLNNDQTLTVDELYDELYIGLYEGDVTPDPLGEDGTLDANDEGFVREDVDGDGTFEIGIDWDQDGSLHENEVLGSDLNNDKALTEDELDT